ncbi:MAG: DoxX family protein, partial [Deefgea sp.]
MSPTVLLKAFISAKPLNLLAPAADLLLRLYVSKVFFLSGLTKIQDWETTVFLFTEEYRTPFLPPLLAAIGGTAAELILPVLLTLGLLTRFAALGLFAVNIVAVVSYYHVLHEVPAALQDHLEWGLMLLMIASIYCSRIGLDTLI